MLVLTHASTVKYLLKVSQNRICCFRRTIILHSSGCPHSKSSSIKLNQSVDTQLSPHYLVKKQTFYQYLFLTCLSRFGCCYVSLFLGPVFHSIGLCICFGSTLLLFLCESWFCFVMFCFVCLWLVV